MQHHDGGAEGLAHDGVDGKAPVPAAGPVVPQLGAHGRHVRLAECADYELVDRACRLVEAARVVEGGHGADKPLQHREQPPVGVAQQRPGGGPPHGVLAGIEPVVCRVLRVVQVQVVQRAGDLVRPRGDLLAVKAERLDGARLPQQVEPHQVDGRLGQQALRLDHVAEALAHLAALFVEDVPLEQERPEGRGGPAPGQYDVLDEQRVRPAPGLVYALGQELDGDVLGVAGGAERRVGGRAAVVPRVEHVRLPLRAAAALRACGRYAVQPGAVQLGQAGGRQRRAGRGGGRGNVGAREQPVRIAARPARPRRKRAPPEPLARYAPRVPLADYGQEAVARLLEKVLGRRGGAHGRIAEPVQLVEPAAPCKPDYAVARPPAQRVLVADPAHVDQRAGRPKVVDHGAVGIAHERACVGAGLGGEPGRVVDRAEHGHAAPAGDCNVLLAVGRRQVDQAAARCCVDELLGDDRMERAASPAGVGQAPEGGHLFVQRMRVAPAVELGSAHRAEHPAVDRARLGKHRVHHCGAHDPHLAAAGATAGAAGGCAGGGGD